ncbi:hypothetical protein [Chloroflexus sp.]|uniref:hypothetical protein n=1 Tax=Chloroflexus sp. TaxID=1904827 RepID=UPI00298F033E|nr:hypothetical protein [Chloroflexus sp.]MDW8405609.1 hypothetical protein [Chloroflexus sp.]
MARFWLQTIGYALRWMLSGAVGLAAVTWWAVAQPLTEPLALGADAVIVAAIAPLDVETSTALAILLNAGAAPIAYLAGSHAETFATDLAQRGVTSERLRILTAPETLLPTANAAGHRRLIIAAPSTHRLTLVRQAQTMGFAVAALESGPPPALSDRVAATLLYWRALVVWRAN